MRLLLSQNTFTISRATPPAVTWLTVLGALIGACLGWMLTARVSRLVARRHPAVFLTTVIIASLTFVALAPMCLVAGTQFVLGVDHGPPWIALYWTPTALLTTTGLQFGALTLVVAELAQVASAALDRTRFPAR